MLSCCRSVLGPGPHPSHLSEQPTPTDSCCSTTQLKLRYSSIGISANCCEDHRYLFDNRVDPPLSSNLFQTHVNFCRVFTPPHATGTNPSTRQTKCRSRIPENKALCKYRADSSRLSLKNEERPRRLGGRCFTWKEKGLGLQRRYCCKSGTYGVCG